MKRYVNGDETELILGNARITAQNDRLAVHTENGRNSALVVKVGDITHVSYLGRQYKVTARGSARSRSAGPESTGELRSPMPGSIVDVRFAVGDQVKKGDVVVVLEAMKTQQPFAAPFDGILEQMNVDNGNQVAEGVVLAIIKPI